MNDHNLPKTRKKWNRPTTGSSSASSIPCIESNEFDESDIEEPRITYQPAERDHSSLLENSENRTGGASPSSSVASCRPLEWDSGADVGYHLMEITETLSPVECMALNSLKHLKNEGKNTGTPKERENFSKIISSSTKITHSTPISDNFVPPLNLEGLISERKKTPKKYKSLDNLCSNIDKENLKSTQSCFLQKSAFVPQTGSTSSLTTVIPKRNKLKETAANQDFYWLLENQPNEECKQALIRMFNKGSVEFDSESACSEHTSSYSDTGRPVEKFKTVGRTIYQIDTCCSTDRCVHVTGVEFKVINRPESSGSQEFKGSDCSSKYFSPSPVLTSEQRPCEFAPPNENTEKAKLIESQKEKKKEKKLKRSHIDISSSSSKSTHTNSESVGVLGSVENKPDKKLQMLRAVEQDISPIQADRSNSSNYQSVSNSEIISRKSSKSSIRSVKSDNICKSESNSKKSSKSSISSLSGPGPETGAIRKILTREGKTVEVQKPQVKDIPVQKQELERQSHDQKKQTETVENFEAKEKFQEEEIPQETRKLQDEPVPVPEDIPIGEGDSTISSKNSRSTANQKSSELRQLSDKSQTQMRHPVVSEQSNIENKQQKNASSSSEHSTTSFVQKKKSKSFVESKVQKPEVKEQSSDEKFDKLSGVTSPDLESHKTTSSTEPKSDTPVTSSQHSRASHGHSTSLGDNSDSSEASYLSKLRKEIELQRLNEYLWLSYLISNIKNRKQRLVQKREEKLKHTETESSSKSSQSNKIATSRAHKSTQVTSFPKPDTASTSMSQISAILSDSESKQTKPKQFETSSETRPEDSVSKLENQFESLSIKSSNEWSKNSDDGSFKGSHSHNVSETQRQPVHVSIVNKYRQSVIENKLQNRDDTKENDKPTDYSNFDFLGKGRKDLTLQESLRRSHPEFIRHAEYRNEFIADLRIRRQARADERRKHLVLQLANPEIAPRPVLPTTLPPPPLAERRLFSQKEMRERTLKKCKNLEEVRKREHNLKHKMEKEVNRQMASIYRRKLQKRVLNKKPDLSNSMSVITSN